MFVNMVKSSVHIFGLFICSLVVADITARGITVSAAGHLICSRHREN